MSASSTARGWIAVGAVVCAGALVMVAIAMSFAGAGRGTALASAAPRSDANRSRPTGAERRRDRAVGTATLALAATSAARVPVASGAGAGAGPVVPTRSALAATRRYLRGRRGVTSFAVVDSAGRERGHNASVPFASASVVKAMLLVGHLRSARDRALSAGERSVLGPMIRWSDNRAATRIFASQRAPGLRRVARAAGMRRFSVGPTWTSAVITARDQARLFARLDRLLPARHRDYGRGLLSSVVASQAWGIPAGAPPKWRAYFKGGWRPTVRGRLVHQVARLEGEERTVVIAVLSDGNPSHGYGTTTVRQVARRLLAEPSTAGPAASSEPSEDGGPANP